MNPTDRFDAMTHRAGVRAALRRVVEHAQRLRHEHRDQELLAFERTGKGERTDSASAERTSPEVLFDYNMHNGS